MYCNISQIADTALDVSRTLKKKTKIGVDRVGDPGQMRSFTKGRTKSDHWFARFFATDRQIDKVFFEKFHVLEQKLAE